MNQSLHWEYSQFDCFIYYSKNSCEVGNIVGIFYREKLGGEFAVVGLHLRLWEAEQAPQPGTFD